jgi:hypothetical protein
MVIIGHENRQVGNFILHVIHIREDGGKEGDEASCSMFMFCRANTASAVIVEIIEFSKRT